MSKVTNEQLYKDMLGTEKYMSNIMSIARPLGPVDATTILELMEWCSDYNRRTQYPSAALKCFAIGFYQIHQGMEWKDGGLNKYESYAAAVLHFLRLSEQLQLPVEGALAGKFENFLYLSLDTVAYDLLRHLSATQQQLLYQSSFNKVKSRKSRYNADFLTHRLYLCIYSLVRAIRPDLRSEAFYTASKIMTKEI